jgi:hypothetical protein
MPKASLTLANGTFVTIEGTAPKSTNCCRCMARQGRHPVTGSHISRQLHPLIKNRAPRPKIKPQTKSI